MKFSLHPLTQATALVLTVAFTATSLIAQSPAPSAEASPVAAAQPAQQPRTPADAVTPFNKNPPRHAEFLNRKSQGEIGILFVGDSITDFWPRKGEWSWLKFAPYNPADFGVSSERTEHVLWRLTNGELDGINPKVVVLMIGTNNIGQCPDEESAWAAAGITKIVETIHQKLPNAKVLLLGVFPRGKKNSIQRKKVDEVNRIICKLDDGKKTRYLDIGKVFLNENGEIPGDVMPDLLHPNAKGYDLWYGAMNPLLEEMMK